MLAQNIVKLLFICLIASLISACNTLHALKVAYLEDIEQYPLYPARYPLYVEAGGEKLAQTLAEHIPAAISQIESTHGGAILSAPVIVLCMTASCYKRIAIVTEAAGEAWLGKRINLNGEKIQREQRDIRSIFTHELSHHYWSTHGVNYQARWFQEGLAVWVSNGGGAEKASVAEATQAIRNGRVIIPHLDDGLWQYTDDKAENYGLTWPLFYRQAGMFIEYLTQQDPKRFQQLLRELERTKQLKTAWEISYSQSPSQQWMAFVQSLN